MSTKHFTANVISASKVVPDGTFTNSAASGVWTLDEHYDLVRGDNWPNAANVLRALFMGGEPSHTNYTDSVDQLEMASAGNATDFGNLSAAKNQGGACSSSSRALYGGGSTGGSGTNVIEYFTIATAGNATDFGDLAAASYQVMSLSNSTRGIFGGGDEGSASNRIQYVTIASTGNTTDFGDLTVTKKLGATAASSTRGVFYGGDTEVIDYITIASTGDATDFGNASITNDRVFGSSNSTTGVFAGAAQSDGTIYKITIASTGNDVSFGGNLSDARINGCSTSSSTRGFFGSGINNSDVRTNTIDFITYSSAGNAQDFGDLLGAKGKHPEATSSAHGGIA